MQVQCQQQFVNDFAGLDRFLVVRIEMFKGRPSTKIKAMTRKFSFEKVYVIISGKFSSIYV